MYIPKIVALSGAILVAAPALAFAATATGPTPAPVTAVAKTSTQNLDGYVPGDGDGGPRYSPMTVYSKGQADVTRGSSSSANAVGQVPSDISGQGKS